MEPVASKAVFLSYASQNVESARRIADALRAFGVEVWFDQSELRGGEAWDQQIRRQIHACALFLPVISATTQERSEGYFRREWKLAAERTTDMAEGVPFIVPVVVDDVPEASALVPEPFRQVQWTRLPDGVPSPQFVEQVKWLLGLPHKPAAGKRAAVGGQITAQTVRARPRVTPWTWTALAAVIVVAVTSVVFFARRTLPPKVIAESKAASAVSVADDKSIAVLLFKNLSEDKDNNAFFSDGIHEDILTNLAHIRALRVVSRTSVEQYLNSKKSIPQIARELGVTYVLEGSVRRAGNKVRVTGQLIRAATDEHIWAETYDKDLTDIFAIQSELAQRIAGALNAALSPEERKLLAQHPTENIAAYDLYLKARAERQSTRSTRASYEKQQDLLQQAVTLDPSFAAAWAWLSVAHVGLYRNYHDHTDSRLALAKSALDTALRLAPEASDVIGGLRNYYFLIHYDYARAAAEGEKLIRRWPNDPNGYTGLAYVQRRQGQSNEAIVNLRKGLQLDPGDFNASAALATTLAAGRHYDESVAARRRLVELHPNDLNEAFGAAYISFQASGSARDVEEFFAGLTETQRESSDGRSLRRTWADAQGNIAEAIRLDALLLPNDDSTLASAVRHAAIGDMATARAKVEKLPAALRTQLEKEPDNAAAWISLSRFEAILGHTEDALRCARKAVELLPESRDAISGPPIGAGLAFVYAWTGDRDSAIKEYARLLRVPYSGMNVHVMKRHPRYAPLRGDPRFEALLNDPKNNAPLF